MNKYILYVLLVYPCLAKSQTAFDGETMNKTGLCLAATVGEDKWTEYWESKLLRTNTNIGTMKRQNAMAMFAYGINDKMNVIASLPYMRNAASAGTIVGNEGLQDASLHLKYRAVNDTGLFKSKAFLVLGGSIPVGSYNEDAGPSSLGLGAPELNARLTVDIEKGPIFFRPQFSYHHRLNATLYRNFYYDGSQAYYTNKMAIPEMIMASATVGIRALKKTIRLEGSYILQNTIGGSEIRRGEAPLANSNFDAQIAQATLRFDPDYLAGFGLMANAGRVLKGQNVGKSDYFNAGITFRVTLSKPKVEPVPTVDMQPTIPTVQQ